MEDLSTQVGDVHIVVALCALLQAYLQTQPALARESAWVLNNLTGIVTPDLCFFSDTCFALILVFKLCKLVFLFYVLSDPLGLGPVPELLHM